MNNAKEIWTLIYEALKKDHNTTIFNLWFSELELIDITESTAVLKTTTSFKKKILNESFKAKLEGYFEKVVGLKLEVRVVSDEKETEAVEETKKEVEAVVEEAFTEEEEAEEVSKVTFFKGREEYTFENFIVGNSNNFAYNACLAVAKEPGSGDNNPLFLYGPSGLGKTHLLNAITNRILKTKPDTNIVYVTGEKFTDQLIKSIGQKKTEEFRNIYRNADVLLIDDIQFIAGKETTQEEIFHTFNALYEDSRQIIFTSDRPAKDIKNLEERLKTRFNWGPNADITPPDFELRAAIVKKKASQRGIELSNEVVNLLAENITENIRELEGAVRKLAALKMLSDKTITLEVARESISYLIKDKIPENLAAETIISVVCDRYGLTREEIKSSSRKERIKTPRQIAMYIMKEKTGMPLKKIAAKFNLTDHTTVINAGKRIENEIRCNSLFEIEINELIREISRQ